MSGREKREWLACMGFAAAVAAILWITLLSRQQEAARQILPPLRSYLSIARGDRRALLENILNVLLFLPVGLFPPILWKTKGRQVTWMALVGSLLIELNQLIWRLGYFEVDDLLHNTLGAVLGYGIIRMGRFSAITMPRRKSLRVVTIAAVLILLGCAVGQRAYTDYHEKKMQNYAAMNDREDTPNLLTLDGKPGFVGRSGVYVRYLKDGSISISGTSHVRAWKLLAELQLGPGTYSFSGLNQVAEKTVAIQLEYYHKEKEKFLRLTQDVGPVDAVSFTLSEDTRIRAYVGVYPGCDCAVVARPVIFREGD